MFPSCFFADIVADSWLFTIPTKIGERFISFYKLFQIFIWFCDVVLTEIFLHSMFLGIFISLFFVCVLSSIFKRISRFFLLCVLYKLLLMSIACLYTLIVSTYKLMLLAPIFVNYKFLELPWWLCCWEKVWRSRRPLEDYLWKFKKTNETWDHALSCAKS